MSDNRDELLEKKMAQLARLVAEVCALYRGFSIPCLNKPKNFQKLRLIRTDEELDDIPDKG